MSPSSDELKARGWDFEGLEQVDDVSPGAWLLPRLADSQFLVASSVPMGFEAYARIFYPFRSGARWSQVSRQNGWQPHAEMEVEAIVRPDPRGSMPDSSEAAANIVSPRLSEQELTSLDEILRRHTTTPSCNWFCVWDGYGDLGVSSQATPARLRRPTRAYVLYREGRKVGGG